MPAINTEKQLLSNGNKKRPSEGRSAGLVRIEKIGKKKKKIGKRGT